MDFLEGEEEIDDSLSSTDMEGLFKFLKILQQEDLPEDLTNDIQDYLNKVEAEEQGDDVGAPLMAPGIRDALQEPGDPLMAPGIRAALQEPSDDSFEVPVVTREEMTIEDYLDKGGEDAIKYFFDVYAKEEGFFSNKTRLIKEWKRYAAKSSIIKPVIKMVVDKIQREVRE